MHEESQEVSSASTSCHLRIRWEKARGRGGNEGGGCFHARVVAGGEPRFTSFCRFGEISGHGGVRTRWRRVLSCMRSYRR